MVGGMSMYAQDERIRLGIQNFRRRHGAPWRVLDAGHGWEQLNQCMERYAPEGIIAHVLDLEKVSELQALQLPVVALNSGIAEEHFPSIYCNNREVGRIAAEHLLERGLRQLVVYSATDHAHIQERLLGFQERISSEPVSLLRIQSRPWICEMLQGHSSAFGSLPPGLEWMKHLQYPTGIFSASGDVVAVQLCDHAASLGISIPEDVAILGVDNFKLLCENSMPALSSVSMPGEETGYQAACCLERILRGKEADPPAALNPLGIQERRSTEVIAGMDPEMTRALQYLYTHATEDISIGGMVAALNLPRRSLQRKFQTLLGRTPLEELYRRRVELARERLLESSEPMYIVAMECGFKDAESFSRRFREQTGITPSAYRKQHQR